MASLAKVAIDVRSTRRSDIPALARVLGRAFQDDPVMTWVQPDAQRRKAALPGLFGALTRHHYLAGRATEVATSDDGAGAAALWDPPADGSSPRASNSPCFPRCCGHSAAGSPPGGC